MSKSRFLLAAGLMLVALAGASVAQARDNVYWSVGVHAAPGVTLGVGNHRPVYAAPVYVQPAPVYVQPAPIYVQPAPIYVPAPRVYYPQNYYVQHAPAYPVYYDGHRGRGHWHGKHHHKHHKHHR
jgi:hypothetical protein